jgi:hypothetical protein
MEDYPVFSSACNSTLRESMWYVPPPHCSAVQVIKTRPGLWCSGQSSWLQIQRSGFDFQHYQILREVVGLEQGPLSLMSTIEELLGRKSSSSSLVEPRI